MCGASNVQEQLQTTTTGAYNTAIQSAQSVFGSASSVFKSLMSTFAPTVAAGPSQNGFSAQTLSGLNSSAITQTGVEAKNEKAALGNSEAAVGGGTSDLPSGGTIGANLSLAENAGNQTAGELSQIQLADEQQGNANYKEAVAGEEGATQVFNPATSATNAATDAGKSAITQTQNVATANQGSNPWQLAAGALGGAVGLATGNPAGVSAILNTFKGNNTQGGGGGGGSSLPAGAAGIDY